LKGEFEMKILRMILFLLVLPLLYSCMSTSFVYTGDYHQSVPDNSYIKVVIDDNKNLAYDEIGVIEVRESLGSSNFAEIVNKARDEARDKGADCIIYMNRSTSISGSGDAISAYNQYFFKAVKLKQD
jgi:hypothetical protein